MLAINSLTTLAALATSAFALVNPHHDQPRHHVPKNIEVRVSNFTKRSYSGQATFYEAGLGACGGYNTDSDFIVALNIEQWDGGSHCNQAITITSDKGITQGATITDQCPGCAYGALDMTPALFQSLGHTADDGVFQMTWDYGGGGAPAPAPAPDPQTSSTPEWTPPPSSTWQPPPTTSSPPPPPPTSSAAPTTTSAASSSSSVASSAGSSASDSSASGTATDNAATSSASAGAGTGDVSKQTGGNLNAQSKLLVQMANIIAAGGSS